jgi:hypothetical protein
MYNVIYSVCVRGGSEWWLVRIPYTMLYPSAPLFPADMSLLCRQYSEVDTRLTCDWDEFGVKQFTCPGGEVLVLQCNGTKVAKDVTCGFRNESHCAIWDGKAWDASLCSSVLIEEGRTTCECQAAASAGGAGASTGVFMDVALVPSRGFKEDLTLLRVGPIEGPYVMVRTVIVFVTIG